MSFSPSPLQTLFLWRLLASEGGDFRKNIKPRLTSKVRKALETAGFVVVEKRKEAERKGARPIFYDTLSEQGWDWAAGNLDAPFSTQSTAAGPILQVILRKVKAHLTKTSVSLADLICPSGQPDVESASDVFQRVREGYCQVSGGRWNVRVRLADLRRALADVPLDRLHAALLAMERDGGIVLYPLDDPQEIRPEDEAAGLPNTLGIRRHIVYIEG